MCTEAKLELSYFIYYNEFVMTHLVRYNEFIFFNLRTYYFINTATFVIKYNFYVKSYCLMMSEKRYQYPCRFQYDKN